jgi:hypothetical protein
MTIGMTCSLGDKAKGLKIGKRERETQRERERERERGRERGKEMDAWPAPYLLSPTLPHSASIQ